MVILGVLRQHGPLDAHSLEERLHELHAQGAWPLAEWPGAHQAPYAAGLYQLLRQMQSRGWIKDEKTGWCVLAKAPAAPLPLPPEEVERAAAALLPDPACYEPRLRAYEQVHGFPVILGVDYGLRRVVRVQTGRGAAEIRVRGDDWDGALREIGA